MNKSNEKLILFFMKYPEKGLPSSEAKGQVKTRLAKELGEIATFELYKNFVLDLLSMLETLEIHLWICFYPVSSQEKLVEWLGEQYCYVSQKGDNLGQNMKNSFIHAFASGYRRVIVIGSDSPDLPGEFINEAFRSLKTNDIVIGPALDGGYYLIGFRYDTFLPEVFEGINWSTDTVFGETMNILAEAGCKIHILPEWSDVDTLVDLKNLFMRNQDTAFRYSKTISYIHKEVLQNGK